MYNIELAFTTIFDREDIMSSAHLEPKISKALWYNKLRRTELSPLIERFVAFRQDDPQLAKELIEIIEEKSKEIFNVNTGNSRKTIN